MAPFLCNDDLSGQNGSTRFFAFSKHQTPPAPPSTRSTRCAKRAATAPPRRWPTSRGPRSPKSLTSCCSPRPARPLSGPTPEAIS